MCLVGRPFFVGNNPGKQGMSSGGAGSDMVYCDATVGCSSPSPLSTPSTVVCSLTQAGGGKIAPEITRAMYGPFGRP